jgi:hypothetical protein
MCCERTRQLPDVDRSSVACSTSSPSSFDAHKTGLCARNRRRRPLSTGGSFVWTKIVFVIDIPRAPILTIPPGDWPRFMDRDSVRDFLDTMEPAKQEDLLARIATHVRARCRTKPSLVDGEFQSQPFGVPERCGLPIFATSGIVRWHSWGKAWTSFANSEFWSTAPLVASGFASCTPAGVVARYARAAAPGATGAPISQPSLRAKRSLSLSAGCNR